MSYCRWSSDGHQCDVYCYEDSHGGYRTHVAARRRPKRAPDIDFTSLETISKTLVEQRAVLDEPGNEPRPIGLPHDGESFWDETLEELLRRLLHLRSVGYNVPDRAFDVIRGEMADEEERSA